MPISIGSNIASLRAQRHLNNADRSLTSTFERLSSGQRINKSSDDAAGLAISSALDLRSRVYSQAVRNVNDTVSLLNITEGALSQLSGIVTRQHELAEQSANGTYSTQQRLSMNREANALSDEYNRILESTTYNGINVLDGNSRKIVTQQGFGADATTSVVIGQELGPAAGDGTFTAMAGNTVSNMFDALRSELADINGDGALDAIGGYQYSNQIRVQLGNGRGGFDSGTVYTTGVNWTSSITSGDLNNDGYADLAVAHESEGVSILYGSASGTLTPGVSIAHAGVSASEVSIVDLDNDGRRDLIVGSTDAPTLFRQSAQGSFNAIQTLAFATNFSRNLGAADYNNDGFVDVATSGHGNTTVDIWLNDSTGKMRFAGAISATFGGTRTLTVGDFNRDGNFDIATDEYNGDTIGVHLGNGNGSFRIGTTISTGNGGDISYGEIIAGDVNGDGYDDLVYGEDGVVGNLGLMVQLGNGDGTFRARVSYGQYSSAGQRGLALGDLTGDGILDIVRPANLTVLAGNADASGRRNVRQDRLDITNQLSARATLDALNVLGARITSELGSIGATQSRLEVSVRTLAVARENYMAANSRIRDAEVASDSANLVRQQILQQAAAATLSQANQQPSIALSLLRS